MILPLQITRDSQGYMTTGSQMGRDFPILVQRVELTADAVKSVTTPTGNGTKMIAYFSFTKAADVFVQPGSSPVLAYPTGTVDTAPSELNPIARIVGAGEVLQFLSSATNPFVTISYYAVL